MSLWGNNDSVSVSGTIEITQNADTLTGNVVGASTDFTNEVKIGNYLICGSNTYVVTTIANADFATVKAGVLGATVTAQAASSSYNIQQAPASVPLSEVAADASKVYGVDTTEMAVSNGSVIQYITTFAGSGYSANALVTVGGNATANGLNTGGRISVLSVLPGNTYTTIPAVTVAAPTAVVFNGNTNVSGATIAITTANSKFLVGDKITYAGNASSTPGGLTDNGTYYIAFSNTSVITLAVAPGGANIALTKASGDGTTAGGATITGETATAAAVLSGAKGLAAHAGWVRRTVGTGGRAGRVQEETLVAMGSIANDLEDTVMKDA